MLEDSEVRSQTPPTIEEIQQRLKQIFLEASTEPVQPKEVTADLALAGHGMALDSVALLEFVIRIENEFSIILDDGSLKSEYFETLGTLAELIQTRIGEPEKS